MVTNEYVAIIISNYFSLTCADFTYIEHYLTSIFQLISPSEIFFTGEYENPVFFWCSWLTLAEWQMPPKATLSHPFTTGQGGENITYG